MGRGLGRQGLKGSRGTGVAFGCEQLPKLQMRTDPRCGSPVVGASRRSRDQRRARTAKEGGWGSWPGRPAGLVGGTAGTAELETASMAALWAPVQSSLQEPAAEARSGAGFPGCARARVYTCTSHAPPASLALVLPTGADSP